MAENLGVISSAKLTEVLTWPDFVPAAPEVTDRHLAIESGLAGVSVNSQVEPFGSALAVEALRPLRGTGGPTNPKGGGKYDDYKTQDE